MVKWFVLVLLFVQRPDNLVLKGILSANYQRHFCEIYLGG